MGAEGGRKECQSGCNGFDLGREDCARRIGTGALGEDKRESRVIVGRRG